MLKRVNWILVFKCFAWIVCLGGIVTLMSFVGIKKRTVNCSNIKILIPGADNFIEREEIDAILKQNEGQLIGRNLERINLHAIEEKIKSNPYIALSTVYADMDGVIHIEISQRQPLLRIINASGQDFYIDREGLKMPVSPNFTANVVVANGRILENFGGKVDTLVTKMASDLYKTALFLKKDTLWDAQIEQLFVNEKDDIVLVPRVGNQRIVLGTADSLETKMANLLAFYKKAMPQVGWDTYKTINIKYTNQIVCEKNNLDSMNKLTTGRKLVAKPTPASAKKVMDSIVKAEIMAELRNNPEETTDITTPQKKSSPAMGKVISAAVKAAAVKHTVVKAPVSRPNVVKPAVTKPPATHKVVKPDVVHKPAAETKPAHEKAAIVKKPAGNQPVVHWLPAAKPKVKPAVVKKNTEKEDTRKNN